ncbi:hypothetical protein P171DRAFT_526435 [Karstenula rhodostoma CBS 690.94]|uniref:Uncharacterized protein n=1 Tax=Karstenula rhodostoma CBS 690.94 TaxID=1392251 RepID=A0A9P4U5Y2_9PLEO|nr:hypothetical protein P171DRAFT_526435 [Karstenula rhodostoma CBS 690.94]
MWPGRRPTGSESSSKSSAKLAHSCAGTFHYPLQQRLFLTIRSRIEYRRKLRTPSSGHDKITPCKTKDASMGRIFSTDDNFPTIRITAHPSGDRRRTPPDLHRASIVGLESYTQNFATDVWSLPEYMREDQATSSGTIQSARVPGKVRYALKLFERSTSVFNTSAATSSYSRSGYIITRRLERPGIRYLTASGVEWRNALPSGPLQMVKPYGQPEQQVPVQSALAIQQAIAERLYFSNHGDEIAEAILVRRQVGSRAPVLLNSSLY